MLENDTGAGLSCQAESAAADPRSGRGTRTRGINVISPKKMILVLTPTPQPIVERLNREIVKVLQQGEAAKRLEGEGAEVVGSSPQQFETHIKFEYEKWGKLIKQAGIRAE